MVRYGRILPCVVGDRRDNLSLGKTSSCQVTGINYWRHMDMQLRIMSNVHNVKKIIQEDKHGNSDILYFFFPVQFLTS